MIVPLKSGFQMTEPPESDEIQAPNNKFDVSSNAQDVSIIQECDAWQTTGLQDILQVTELNEIWCEVFQSERLFAMLMKR